MSKGWYWAEMKLPAKITFYTEIELKRRGILDKLEDMRNKYRLYKRFVNLDSTIIKRLESEGITVMKTSFLALKGEWHWFSGYSNMDAFRLTERVLKNLEKDRFFVVKLEQPQKLLTDHIEKFKRHLERYKISTDDIQKMTEALMYIYKSQGGSQTGVLVSEIHDKFENESEILLNLEYIHKSRWYRFETYSCSGKGERVGKQFIAQEIAGQESLLFEILNSLPKTTLFYWALWKIKPTYAESGEQTKKGYYTEGYPLLEMDLLLNYEKYMFESEKIQTEIVHLWNQLLNFNLVVKFQDYVSTRGGELRDRVHVLSPELVQTLENFLDQEVHFELYRTFKLIKILSLYGYFLEKNLTPNTKLSELLNSHDFSISNLENFISFLHQKGITSELITTETPPFIIFKRKEYWKTLYRFLADETAITDFLQLDDPGKQIDKKQKSRIEIEDPEKILEDDAESQSKDPILSEIEKYIQEKEKIYRQDKIDIKQMSKEIRLNRGELIKKLIVFCSENRSWVIDENNRMLYKRPQEGFRYAKLTEKKGGGFSFGLYNIEVGARWKESRFELKCSECGNKDKLFTFDKKFDENGVLFCEKCKTILQIPNFKKYFSA